MVSTYYKIGDWNNLCAECGAKFKSSELKLTWDGFRMCHTCWQPRNQQDFVRNVSVPKGVPWSQDRPPLSFANPATRPDGSDPAIVPMPVDSP